jgi:hypothetical protein
MNAPLLLTGQLHLIASDIKLGVNYGESKSMDDGAGSFGADVRMDRRELW